VRGGKTPLNQEEARPTWSSDRDARTGFRAASGYREALRAEVANTVSDPAEAIKSFIMLYQILTA